MEVAVEEAGGEAVDSFDEENRPISSSVTVSK